MCLVVEKPKGTVGIHAEKYELSISYIIQLKGHGPAAVYPSPLCSILKFGNAAIAKRISDIEVLVDGLAS